MRQKGFAPILLVIVLALIGIVGAYYIGTKKGDFVPPLLQTLTQNTATTKPTTDPTANWKVYTSSVFNYSFKYPITWSALMFKETNSEIIVGAHSLQNYSPTEVEKFMDHGSVDWASFLGEKPAIKIDFAVYSKLPGPNQYQDKNEFLNNLLNESANKLDTSDLKIGNLTTEQYKATKDLGPTDAPEINTFVAYPDDDRIIYMGLLFWNIKSYELLKKTPEWQEFSQILSTFKFTQ